MRTGTVSYKLEDLKKGVIIPIGFVGENDFTRVIFDAEEIYKKYPSASVSMKVQPPKGVIYPAAVTRDGNTVIWQVKESDVANRGGGELQLTFIDGETKIKTYIAKTDVKRSLAGNGPAPDPVQDWVDNAEEVLDDLAAMDNIAKTAEAGDVGKALSPKTVENGVVTEWQFVEPGAGTDDYADLDNKPSIAGVTLSGNKTLEDLGIAADDDLDNLAEEVSDVKTAIHGISDGGKLLDNGVKSALLGLFNHVAFIDDKAQVYINALKTAWEPSATLSSITAVFTQGSAVINIGDNLDTLRQYLVVTGNYTVDGDTFTDEVVDYTLSGTLEAGESTITVTYKNKTTTFTVYVESLLPSGYQQVEYVGATAQDQYILFDNIHVLTADELSKYTFAIDFCFDEWNSAANSNIIAGFSSEAGLWIGYNNTVLNIAMGTASGYYFTDNNPTARHEYEFSFKKFIGSYGKSTITRDDDNSISRETLTNNFNENNTFALFSATTSQSGSGRNSDFDFKGKIYSFSMTYEGQPLLNLVPCYRKSDGEIGFYDTVGETFYGNSGNGTFTKGGNV